MTEVTPPERPLSELKIGDRVPMPPKKLVVRPSRNADDPKRGLRGAFSSGSRNG